ncbi:MAG: hypothetical protein HXS50_03790, partial [Theionarchaea archaeon]|nr:hypothetical protein [Theionarchaea archaeon]
MPFSEQAYRNIVTRMRVDHLFHLVLQIRRENMDTIVAPVLKEVDYRISKSSSTKSYHEAPRIPFRS